MKSKEYDIIIVGAGPAGLALAEKLASEDFKILVLDKKKNAKDVQYHTSGSFINPKEWNLPRSILNPISKCYIISKNKGIVKKGKGVIINRQGLLEFLEKRAKKNKNLELCYGVVIKEICATKNRILWIKYLKDKKGFKVSAKIYVDCSGFGVVLGRKINLNPKYVPAIGVEYLVPLKREPDAIDLILGSNLKGGYGWIFPLNKNLAIIGYGTLFKDMFPKVESGLKKMWEIKRVKERCEFKPLEKRIGVLRTGNPPKRLVKNNIILIGDSALQANPLVGEGIRFVMDSARIASKWIKVTLKTKNLKHLKNYEKEWKKKYYKKYKVAFKLQRLMKKITKSDKLIDLVVRAAGKVSEKSGMKILKGDVDYRLVIKIWIKLLKYLFCKSFLRQIQKS